MKDLFLTQWSAIAAGEDAKEQTWHTDVDKLPGTLPSKGELPGHLSMMLVLSDKYHLEVHLGSHLGEHDALRVETFEFQRGDRVLFASTVRHRGLAALPRVEKQVVLFRFMGCSVLGRGAEPPQFWVLLIWLEPGISHVTWVHYDATMCLPCIVCSILPVLHFLRFDLCVL